MDWHQLSLVPHRTNFALSNVIKLQRSTFNLFAHWSVSFDENRQFDQSQFVWGDAAALPLTSRWYRVDVVDISVIGCGVGVQLHAINRTPLTSHSHLYRLHTTRSTQPCIPLRSLNRVPALVGWRKGGNVTSARWQVTLSDPIWHVSSRSGAVLVAQTAIRFLTLPYQTRTRVVYDTGFSIRRNAYQTVITHSPVAGYRRGVGSTSSCVCKFV